MPKSDAYIHSNHADITVCQFNLAHHIPEIIGKTSQFLHNYAEYNKKAPNVAMITLMVLLHSHQLPVDIELRRSPVDIELRRSPVDIDIEDRWSNFCCIWRFIT